MDVINISGVQFRMRPDVTVGKVLEVFRGLGREGILQRNGIVELLDSPIDFNSEYPYKFVNSSEILVSDFLKYRNDARCLSDVAEVSRSTGLLDIPKSMLNRQAEKVFPTKSLYTQSLLDMPTALLDQPVEYLPQSTADYLPASSLFGQNRALYKPSRLINQPIELLKQQQEIKLYDDAVKASPIQEATAFLNQPVELIEEQEKLKLYNETLNAKIVPTIAEMKALMQPTTFPEERVLYQPTAMLNESIEFIRQQEKMKLYNDALLKKSLIEQPVTLLNQPSEFLGQRGTKFYNDDIFNRSDLAMIAPKYTPMQQSRTPFDMYPSTYIEPKFYQFVVIKARQNNYLNLDNIEVYNMNGQNIVNRAAVFSDACVRAGLMPYYRKFLAQKEILRGSMTGGFIRLRFDERLDSISRIVLISAKDELQFNKLLTGALLEVRKVNEYTLNTDGTRIRCINSYPNTLINAIEIRAPADRFLRLSKIRVINDLEETINDLITFDSSDMAMTRRDVTARQLLLQNEEMSEDYIESAMRGGYIRLTLAQPMRVKSLQLVGALRGVKVTMETLRSYTCSNDFIQNFSF